MTEPPPRDPVPVAYHAAAAGLVGGMLLLGATAPDAYDGLVQEDRAVEWATVILFLAAFGLGLGGGLRRRRGFDLLVALFCLFVAGEEISWGQRLLGFTPPEIFLEENRQQELTLHNFARLFGQPKWMLAAALALYGILLPALGVTGGGRRALQLAGATAPPAALVPWFAGAIGLLWWYPLEFTGEWVELLAGSLFLAALAPPPAMFGVIAGVAVVVGASLTALTARTGTDPLRLLCARSEIGRLAELAAGTARPPFLRGGRVHKRLHTAIVDGYIAASIRDSLTMLPPCPEGGRVGEIERRRRYMIDPWGTAYWVRSASEDTGRRLGVYSFGPNRRRDGTEGGEGDDVVRTLRVAAMARVR